MFDDLVAVGPPDIRVVTTYVTHESNGVEYQVAAEVHLHLLFG